MQSIEDCDLIRQRSLTDPIRQLNITDAPAPAGAFFYGLNALSFFLIYDHSMTTDAVIESPLLAYKPDATVKDAIAARLQAQEAGETYYFDPHEARLVVEFFRKHLQHVKGDFAGDALDLQPWAWNELVIPLFAWKRTADALRRYRRAYVEIPRKNGKSTIAAGLALYLLFMDDEAGAEVYVAAADRDQAKIVYDVAKEMTTADPHLRTMSRPMVRSIFVPETASVCRVLSSDAKTKHGFNAHGVIVDELHAQANRDLWDVLTTSVGARAQPLIVAITTAGFDKNSICYEQHDYAEKVLDGRIIDEEFLPIIYNAGIASDDPDWISDVVLERANPAIGVTISREYLEAERKRAIEVPAYENTFKRLHLNIWTEQSDRWLQLHSWDATSGFDVDPAKLEGRQCYAGLDLSSNIDITALSLVFPSQDHDDVLTLFWIPEEGLRKRVQRDGVPYDVWTREGWISTTSGSVIDYSFIESELLDLREKYDIAEIAIDPWNATQLAVRLKETHGFNVIAHRQGFASMSAPSKELEARVLSGRLHHGNNPVLRWMIGNAALDIDAAGNIKPAKNRSTEKIDGVVALVMALSGVIRNTGEKKRSGYEDRGLTFL